VNYIPPLPVPIERTGELSAVGETIVITAFVIGMVIILVMTFWR